VICAAVVICVAVQSNREHLETEQKIEASLPVLNQTVEINNVQQVSKAAQNGLKSAGPCALGGSISLAAPTATRKLPKCNHDFRVGDHLPEAVWLLR
jgi:hypothetical protein